MSKIVIIGAGHVGSHCAFALTLAGVGDEIVLIDIDRNKAAAQALDIADAAALLPGARRLEGKRVQYTAHEMPEAYRAFRALVSMAQV